VQAWDQYTHTPLGRLREALTLHYLSQHLDLHPARAEVLDLGAGTGGYALALAEQGHRVCLVDFSAPMLDVARHRAAERGLLDQIQFLHFPLEDLPRHFATGGSDLVLCHTLLEYVGDPWAALRDISASLRPGGLLSLLFANTHAGPLRWALGKSDIEQACRAVRQGVCSADLFGLARRTFAAEELSEALAGQGIAIAAAYGVRVLADYLPADRLAREEYWTRVYELEASMGERFPYRDIARYGYLVGRKESGA
jgi:S-adenosylmethionine-dependent methyltransferase